MSVKTQSVLTDSDLNRTDQELLDLLQETAVHPAWAADQLGVSRQYINDRLKRLVEHGVVDRPERGFYVLRDDPRGAADE
ncbi:MAG: type IV toxin-antitoxin system AbiEi family antitoxin domain-containing protein [Salinarchaeum sp.]